MRLRYDRNTGSFQDSEALFHSCCDLFGGCWCILAQMDGIYSCQCICLTNSSSSFFIFCRCCHPLCVCLFPKQRNFELYTDPCLFQVRWFPLRVSSVHAARRETNGGPLIIIVTPQQPGKADSETGVYKYSFTRQSTHAILQFFNVQ